MCMVRQKLEEWNGVKRAGEVFHCHVAWVFGLNGKNFIKTM
ncbi:MAG: hypothetical protein ACLTF6_13425 [Clostridium sp.]